MTCRDHWALGQWFRHYSRHLGAQNLYVVAHGADPKVAEICPGASVITVPRDRLDAFDARRSRVLNGLQAALVELYDWVIRTDTDELICLDPARHASFAALFAERPADAVFALGLNVAERPGDSPLRPTDPALAHRRGAVFSGHYSKAFAVRAALPLMRHGIGLRPRRVSGFPFDLPRGVYLAHLKFADRAALAETNPLRREVANAPVLGRPGTAWRDPDAEAKKFFRRFSDLPETGWAEAESDAWTRIAADPLRDLSKGLIRARNIRADHRTTLPDWFGDG